MRQSLKMVRNGVVGGVFVCCAVLLLHGWGGENQARTTALEGGGTTYVTPGKYDSSLADMMGELTQNSLHAKQEVHAETMVSAGQEGTASSLKSAMVHILRDLGDDVDFDQDGDEVPGAKKLSRDQVEDLLESADDARAAVKNAARSLRLLQERQRAVRAKAQQLIEGLRSKMEALDTHNGEIGGRITKVGEMRGPEGPKGVSGLPGPDGISRMPGPRGARGPPGVTGNPGPHGSRGLQGPIGPLGYRGGQGPTGSPGERGPLGVEGQGGAMGAPGMRGEVGRGGKQGPGGAMGFPGGRGQPGVNGGNRAYHRR